MSALDIAFAVILMAVIDRAAWEVFVAVAGPFAILYMAFLVFLEASALAKSGADNLRGL